MKVEFHQTSNGSEVLFTGPPLAAGPLPALFYFALSAQDSLQKDPFNQPVQFLDKTQMRVFSMTIPGHEDNLPPENALNVWAERMKKGEAVIPPFIHEVKEAVADLNPYILEGKCFVAGLSRGAFIACHVAAVCPEISHILGFAPLTRLTYQKGFQGEGGEKLNLEHLAPAIYDRKIRFYIGNIDTRVGTENAFAFVQKLVKTAYNHRIRSAPIELIIGPSIGYQGHGTSPEVFQAGVEWVKHEL